MESRIQNMKNSSQQPLNRELLEYKLNEIQARLNSIDIKLDSQVVLRPEFELRVGRLEKLTYGTIGLALTALASTIFKFFIH